MLIAAHTHRAYDYGRAVKETVDAGAIGRPVLVRLAILGGWIWPDWSAWVLDPERSGGHALHNGVHLLDLATWWLGDEPSDGHARGRKQTAAELRDLRLPGDGGDLRRRRDGDLRDEPRPTGRRSLEPA